MQAIVSLPDHQFVNPDQNMIKKFDPSLKKDNPLEFFEITTEDNVTMEGWIVKPKNMDPNKKYPVLFYFYSEPAGQTGQNRFGAGYNRLYDGNLSEDGYVYVTFDSRYVGNNFIAEWSFLDDQKDELYSFWTVNMDYPTVIKDILNDK